MKKGADMSVYKKKRKDGTIAWYYYFCYQGKRYRAIGGATKTQALRTQEKVRSQVISGQYELEMVAADVKIQDFAVTYLERRQHLKSRKRDALSVRTLLKYFQGQTLSGIQPSDIEDYIVYRKSNVSNATVNRELSCLKRMYNLAIRWKQAKVNPVNQVEFLKEPPGRTRYLTIEEAIRLIACCNSSLRPIVITALNTGMRLSEILGLQWKQVHTDTVIEPYIELNQTKNNKRRVVPINDELVNVLEALRGKHPEYVFIGERGNPLKSVRTVFEKAVEKAGIVDFHFHDLRHTFASHFIMQGGDPLALKEILGHHSLKMVERYTHLAQAHKRKQVNNLSGLFSERHLNATSNKVADLSTAASY